MRGFCMVGWGGMPRRVVFPFSGFVSVVAALLFAILAMAPVEDVRAQVVPGGGNDVIAQLISKVTGAKLAELGFSVEEQSAISATYAAINALTAAKVGSAVLPWLGVAAQFAVAAGLMLTPTQLGDDSLTAWQLNHDGTISVSTVTPGSGNYPALTSAVAHVWCGGGQGGNGLICGSSVEAAMEANVQYWGAYDLSSCNSASWCFYLHNQFDSQGLNISVSDMGALFQGKNVSCASGMSDGNGVCMAYAPVVAPPAAGVSVATAISGIPSSDDALPLNPLIVADLVDGLWEQAAAQPGYQGVPYPADNPVTADDVSTVDSPTSSDWPSVGTAAAPVSAPTGGGNPYAIPVGVGAPTGGTAPSGGASGTSPSNSPGLCAQFPDIIACQTPGSATAPDLPSSSGSVSVSPVTVGASDGVCPSPVSVSVLGADFSLSYQAECDFMSRVRPFVLAMCGIIAALVFGAGLKS